MATTTIEDVVRAALVEGGAGLGDPEIVDVEVKAGMVRVTLDRPGGIDLDTLAGANRLVSAALDRHDPVPGRYTLEVSSPGLERALRTPEHFRRFVGAAVSVKTRPGVPGERRVSGRLAAADDTGVTVAGPGDEAGRRIQYADIEEARTVFEWGPGAAPGRAGPPHRERGGSRREWPTGVGRDKAHSASEEPSTKKAITS